MESGFFEVGRETQPRKNVPPGVQDGKAPGQSDPAVVHQLAEAAAARYDVPLRGQTRLILTLGLPLEGPSTEGPRDRVEHGLARGHAPIQPERVHGDLDAELPGELEHGPDELGRDDEIQRDDPRRTAIPSHVLADGTSHTAAGGTHAVREEDEPAIDITADLAATDRSAGHVLSGIDGSAHHQVILPHKLWIQEPVEGAVTHLAGYRAAACDVDDDGRDLGIDGWPVPDRLVADQLRHAGRNVGDHVPELVIHDPTHQARVEHGDERVEQRLDHTFGAEPREQGQQNYVTEHVNARAITMSDLARTVAGCPPRHTTLLPFFSQKSSAPSWDAAACKRTSDQSVAKLFKVYSPQWHVSSRPTVHTDESAVCCRPPNHPHIVRLKIL